MKRLINITHTDSDGVGCGVVCSYFAQRHGLEPEIHHCGYSSITEEVKNVIDNLENTWESIGMLIISDISVKEGTNVDVLLNRATKAYPSITFRLLDHHATADWLNKYDWAEVHETDEQGVKRCGAWWTFKFLSEFFKDYENDRIEETMVHLNDSYDVDVLPKPLSLDPLLEYVTIVDLYDTWKWVEDYEQPYELAADIDRLLKIKGAEEFSASILQKLQQLVPDWREYKGYKTALIDSLDESLIHFKVLEIQRQIKQKEREMMVGTYRYFLNTDRKYEQMKKHLIEKYATNRNELFKQLKKWRRDSMRIYQVGVIYCNDNLSEIGNAIVKNHPELDFIIMISFPGSISYRSCKNLDVPLGLIANDIGKGQGGGHDKSSGSPIKFKVTKETSESLIQGLMLK